MLKQPLTSDRYIGCESLKDSCLEQQQGRESGAKIFAFALFLRVYINAARRVA
jgi:hypothetical protein